MDKKDLEESFKKALKEAVTKCKKEVKAKEGKNNFNLFNALGVSRKETCHSAFLGYLLDQNEDHYQSIFLEEFLLKLLKDKEEFSGIKAENVEWIDREYTLKNRRRIDLLIACKDGGDDVYILIENKIGAGDQESQIRDYVEKLGRGKKVLVIYLTADKKDPSPKSLNGWKIQEEYEYECECGEEQFQKIYGGRGAEKAYYFNMTYCWIREWLEECLKKITKDSKKLVGKSTKGENGLDKIIFGINQYLEILKKINGEYEERNEILKVIEKSEYRQFALDIYRNESKYYGEIKGVWDKFSERVVREFYDKLQNFLYKKSFFIMKNNKERWYVNQYPESGRKFSSCYYYRLKFFSETYYSESMNIWIGLNFYFNSSNYGCPSIDINTWFEDENEEEEMRREKISIGQKEIITNLRDEAKKEKWLSYHQATATYEKKNFLKLEDGENLVSWIIGSVEKGEDPVTKFLRAVKDFANNSIISEAYKKLDQLIAENPRK